MNTNPRPLKNIHNPLVVENAKKSIFDDITGDARMQEFHKIFGGRIVMRHANYNPETKVSIVESDGEINYHGEKEIIEFAPVISLYLPTQITIITSSRMRATTSAEKWAEELRKYNVFVKIIIASDALWQDYQKEFSSDYLENLIEQKQEAVLIITHQLNITQFASSIGVSFNPRPSEAICFTGDTITSSKQQ